jgi:hypothetical protein
VGNRVEVRIADVYSLKLVCMILPQIVFYLRGADGTGSIVEYLEGELGLASRHSQEFLNILISSMISCRVSIPFFSITVIRANIS